MDNVLKDLKLCGSCKEKYKGVPRHKTDGSVRPPPFDPTKSAYHAALLKSFHGDVKKAKAAIKNAGFPVFNFRGGKKINLN